MPHSLRKIRKFRGSRTVGYGRIGQHRDSGSKGHRKVGRHKHLWSWVTTYDKNYFNRSGFTSPQSLHRKNNAINLIKLAEIAPTQQDGKATVDLTSMGYTKLLGTGKITHALTIKVLSCSKSAQEKISKAGGEVIVPSQTHGE
jgi:large subunit ribosomal protein L15